MKDTNPFALPKLVKIIVNMSTKEFLQDKKSLEKAKEELAVITGQRPRVTRARVSVATFKLRQGDEIGLMVTIRGRRMRDFFERLVKVVLPRVRDFPGVRQEAFDGRGNITIGFAEHTAFPEIDSGNIDKVKSLQVSLVTNAGDNAKAKVFLEAMGIPFARG